MDHRSHCPITFALDIFGDKWTLLILRDIIFFDKRFYKDFATSVEGISTNILADRLQKLEEQGILLKKRDKDDRKRFIYAPTKKGLDLIPVMLEMSIWSSEHDKNTAAPPELMVRIKKDPRKHASEIRKRFEKL